jgi:hypothetical protein
LFTSLPDSPQGVGDIVGVACRLVRGNIKLIFNFLLVPTIFTTIAGIAFQWLFTYGVANVAQTRNIGAAFGLAGIWLVGTIFLALAWWILGLRLLALCRLALGFSDNLEDAAQNLYRKKWAVVGTYLLCVVLFLAAMVAFGIVAGFGVMVAGTGPSMVTVLGFVVFGFGAIASTAIYLLTSHVALCILACEETAVVTVIGRALSLVFRHFWRTMAFGLVFMVTITVISYPMSLPVAVVTCVDALQHGLAAVKEGSPDGYKPPLWILAGAQTWESVMGMYLRPFAVFAFGLFYYDLRLRSEGLDIRRRLELALPVEAMDLER